MKKAQVSLEYLSTYSWAIIILLTIVSVLSYFGFFNERALIQTECESGAFLVCVDSELVDNGMDATLRFKFRNNMKADIEIESIELIEYPAASCSINPSDSVIKRGEIWDKNACTISTEFVEGDIEELSFLIKYKKDEINSPTHYINGGLKTQVRAS